MILLFNLENHPSRASLESVLRLKKAEFRHVPESELTFPLFQLVMPEALRKAGPLGANALGAPGKLSASVTGKLPASPVSAVSAFTDPMIIFAGLSNQEVSDLIDRMNQAGVRIPLKAVLTPTSKDWTPVYLHDHLKEEHEAYEAWRKQKAKGN